MNAIDWLRQRSKAIVATLGLGAQAVNLWAPSYGEPTTATIATIVAVLTALGVYQVKNKLRRGGRVNL